MYKRDNLPKAQPKKKKNEKNRYRNVIMNFRVTQEEKEKIESRIAVSGLQKSDYFIQSLMNQTVICHGNIRMFDSIKTQLNFIMRWLENVQSMRDIDENILESVRMILELYAGLDIEKKE
ncbi:MAG: hypothetical protein LUE86_00715 [Clostridiales bacterium]|nr:hypothetical protein [Clostridiales bacterium]